ncbi:hypothetical protein SFLOR_v1c04380 [Spiroplasma floricola 23-6]|uniref:Uncharacterized protein n=2 Tax=Spiroplasma floricola TaxID=216937 RepID=A0A2K8SF77_9MOLU|nr:hypothetical protein SFLOR_v1c04380 [Spiroplasma floricola 23-6]
MQISLDFLKDNVKNLKSWILILILTLIYFLIFNIAFFTYKANLSFNFNKTEDSSKLIFLNVLFNYVDWFLYFCIIPFLSFWLVNYLKKIKIINYFFERDAYRNLYIMKYIILWFLSSVIILLIITTSMQLLFALFHFWVIGLKNSGFIFKIFIIKELILILYIPICFLLISSISIIFNKIIIMFSNLIFFIFVFNEHSYSPIFDDWMYGSTLDNKETKYQYSFHESQLFFQSQILKPIENKNKNLTLNIGNVEFTTTFNNWKNNFYFLENDKNNNEIKIQKMYYVDNNKNKDITQYSDQLKENMASNPNAAKEIMFQNSLQILRKGYEVYDINGKLFFSRKNENEVITELKKQIELSYKYIHKNESINLKDQEKPWENLISDGRYTVFNLN